MKEFEPSPDFVSRVMRTVQAYEAARITHLPILERLAASRPFLYVMSSCGVFFGIFCTPVVCL